MLLRQATDRITGGECQSGDAVAQMSQPAITRKLSDYGKRFVIYLTRYQ